MPWIATEDLTERAGDNMHSLQVYNGLDCCVTFEVHDSMLRDLEVVPHRENVELIYGFERALQAPSFAMTRRGVRVDLRWRGIAREELRKEMGAHNERFQRLAEAVWGIPMDPTGRKPLNKRDPKDPDKMHKWALNPDSPKQLCEFFYEALNVPAQYKFDKGKRRVSADREALEKIQEFPYAAVFARYIILIRDLKKKIDVLSKAIDSDGRLRCSYNVAGTETGRWSSSSNPFGTGDNLQNWTKKMRRCVVADAGKKLVSIDLAQAESFVTGGLGYRDGGRTEKARSYLDACRSGDLHTSVVRDVWEGLGWTGEPKADKALAETPFYMHHTYRDTAKRLGHGSNYYGKPFQMSKQTKIAESAVSEFQLKYFRKFSGIQAYHRKTSHRLQMDFFITTALGRCRYFFGRPDDDATLRKAIAFDPQSTVGDALNLGLWRCWYYLEHQEGLIEMLLQVHDNIVFQVADDPNDPENEARQNAIIKRALGYLHVPLIYGDEIVEIGADVEVGWNWMPAKAAKGKGILAEKNPDGLIGWNEGTSDERRRTSDPDASGLDWSLH